MDMGDIGDADLLAEIKKLRADIMQKEVQEKELHKEVLELKVRLRRNLLRANRFLQDEIASLPEEVTEAAVKIATTPTTKGKGGSTFGNACKTEIARLGNTVIYKEILVIIGNYFKSSSSEQISKTEIKNFVSKTLEVPNGDALATAIGQYLRYMVNGKAIARLSKGQYKWILKASNDSYIPSLENVADLTK